MGELAAQHRLGVGLERVRAQQPLDEPLHRAAGVGLERRRRPRVALVEVGAARGRRAAARRRARAAPAPPRRRGAPRSRAVGAARPRSRRRPARRRSARSAARGSKRSSDVVDEQRAHARLALVVGRVPAERRAARSGRDDRGVEQVALGVERSSRRRRRSPEAALSARRSSSPRNGSGAAGRGKRVLVQPAEEQRPHAPRAQRRGPVTVHAPGARLVARRAPQVVEHARELGGRGHERAVDGPPARRARPAPSAARRRRARRAPRGRRARAPGRGAGAANSARALGGQALAERGRAARARRGDAVDRVRTKSGWSASHSARACAAVARALAAGALLQAVGQAGPRELPGVRSQVSRSSALPSSSAQRSSARRPRPSGGVPGGEGRGQREGDSSVAEDLLEQRGVLARLAQDDRDVLGREGRSRISRATCGGDELDLGALAAALEQQQRVAADRGAAARRRLEQRALECVQRRALRSARRSAGSCDVLGGRAPCSSWKVSPRPAKAARPGS